MDDHSLSTEKVAHDESKQLHETVNAALKEEGAKVHVFEPDMPAEEKKAQAMTHAQLPSLATSSMSSTNAQQGNNVSKAPGAFVGDSIRDKLPDWYRVGWTGFSRLPNPGDEKAMTELLKTRTTEQVQDLFQSARTSNGDDINDFITQFINEKYFGEWYHNCAVVFISIFFTWLLIKLRFGLMSCFIVGAFFGMSV